MRDNQRQETNDKQSTFQSFRRDVLKAVGAGSALGIFGGTAAANGVGGINQMNDDESTDGDQTVHTVRALIGPSTNPKRPADFFFQPTGLSIETGDVVEFVFETPHHTVTSYHPAFGTQRRLPPGVEAFSSPVLGWDPESLPDDIDEPPAEDGTIDSGGAGDGTEAPSDDGMETTPSENGTATPPATGGGADGNGTSAPGENDTDATGDNGTAEPMGSATDTVSTPDENAQTTPDNGTTATAENGTATPGGDDMGTPAENGTEAPSDGEPTPTDGMDGGTESPGTGDGGVAQPSVWRREFDTAGVYDIHCAPHEIYGHAMRIVVGEETNPEFETSNMENLPEPRAGPAGLARQVLTDVELEPGAIVEAGEVMWEDLQTYNEPDEDGTGDGAPGEGEPGDETAGEETPGGETPTDETPSEMTPDEEPVGGDTDNGTAPGDSGNETMAGNETAAGNESGPI